MSQSRAAGSGASISRLLEVQALQRWGRLTEDACRQHRSWEAQGRRETHSTCLSCHLCRGFCEPGPLSLCSGQYTRESPLHASIRTESLQLCLPLGDLCTVAHQVPLSMGFSRQEYWSGLPCPPTGVLPDPGIEPTSLISPALAGGLSTTSAIWEAPLSSGDSETSSKGLVLMTSGVSRWGAFGGSRAGDRFEDVH